MFAILALGALLNQDERGGRWRTLLLICGSVPTALMIGLRWKIGPDWPEYADIFAYTRLYDFGFAIAHQDPAFVALNIALHRVGAPFWVLNMVCGTIFVAGLTAFCRRQPNPWLAFLTAFPYLVIVVAMSGNRQSLALGFLFFALNALERKKLISFVAWMIVAGLFHGSVLLMLPICLMSYTKNNIYRGILLVVLLALGAHFFQETFGIYARRYSAASIQSTGVVYRLAMNGLAAAFFLAFQDRFGVDDQQRRLWRNMSLGTAALAVLLALIPSSTAVDRFLLYLFPLQFFVLSRLPRAVGNDGRTSGQITLLVIGYAALVQLVFLFFGSFASYYIPYRSIFAS